MYKILKIIIIIMIFFTLISFYYYDRGRIFLKVNNDNRETVYKYLNDKNIKKIAYGREWDEGYIYVYYSIIDIKPDKLMIYEGDIQKGELAKYIRENGYNESSIWKWIIIIFTIIICSCIIQLLILKKRYK